MKVLAYDMKFRYVGSERSHRARYCSRHVLGLELSCAGRCNVITPECPALGQALFWLCRVHFQSYTVFVLLCTSNHELKRSAVTRFRSKHLLQIFINYYQISARCDIFLYVILAPTREVNATEGINQFYLHRGNFKVQFHMHQFYFIQCRSPDVSK